MAEESGPSGGAGRPEEGGRDPWAPPEQRVRMSKQPEHQQPEHPQPAYPESPEQPGGVTGQPTVPAMPGGGASGPPPGAHSPVGPPPTAPEGPHPGAGYGAQGGYGAGGYGPGGYGQSAYAGYGAYPGYGGYGRPDTGWAGAPLPQGTAVASMVVGIVGLVLTVTCWGSFLGVLVAPVALILGVAARRKADRGEGGGRGYATSGFVMGLVGTVLAALCVAFLIWVLTHAEDFENNPDDPYGTGYQDARARVPAVVVPGG